MVSTAAAKYRNTLLLARDMAANRLPRVTGCGAGLGWKAFSGGFSFQFFLEAAMVQIATSVWRMHSWPWSWAGVPMSSRSAPSSPRDDEIGKPVRARVAPQRPGSPGNNVVVSKRRAAPARAVSSVAMRTLSPMTVRVAEGKTSPSGGKGRRVAPARRTEGNHARSASSGQEITSGKPLKQSISAGSEEVIPNAPVPLDMPRPISELTRSPLSPDRLSNEDLERMYCLYLLRSARNARRCSAGTDRSEQAQY